MSYFKKLQDIKQEIQTMEMAARKIEHKMNTLENGIWLAEQQTVTFKTYPKDQFHFYIITSPLT